MAITQGIVYQVTNKVNGKIYIGITKYSLKKRWGEHLSNSRINNGFPSNTSLCRAIRKYGADNFIPEQICSVLDNRSLGDVERFVIHQRRPEYNQTGGGEITKGRRILSSEARQRISKQKRALWQDPQRREKLLASLAKAQSIPYTEARRQRLSILSKGRRHTIEAREKMSAIAMRNRTADRFNGFRVNRSIPVKCENDGLIFSSAKAADLYYGFSVGSTWKVVAALRKQIHGKTFSGLEA